MYMQLFDTYVQVIKYKVLCEVAKLAFREELTPAKLMNISNIIIPDGEPTMRCCIYKERAIVNERVSIALGESDENHVIEVLQIACNECPVDGIQVSQSCRGCIAHRCMNACPKGAISIVNHKAQIDKTKCIECGMCLAACPYSAIVKNTRPCVTACKADAIYIDRNQKANIDREKCISCGACVYQCPFGAITDKSYITHAISLINHSNDNQNYKVFAVVAPSIASQYKSFTIQQVTEGIQKLGFYGVVEAAWGADMVAYMESEELLEKGFLTSSCCPAFVEYIEKHFPQLKDAISSNLSPMAQIGKYLKEQNPGCKVVFIGPCIAKKGEALKESVSPYIDCVITFEEMHALFDAKEIHLGELQGIPLESASYFGRNFAKSGGVTASIAQALRDRGVAEEQFSFRPAVGNGLLECKSLLLKKQKGVLGENFIEGMACVGGCIGGPACLSHTPASKGKVEGYGKMSDKKTVKEALPEAFLKTQAKEEHLV